MENPEEDNLLLLGIDQQTRVDAQTVIQQVEAATGIPKPAWFSAKGITVEQLQAMRK